MLRKLTKYLYKIRGGACIADTIRRAHAKRKETLLIKDFDRSLKFYCDLNEHMGSYIFWKGYYSIDQLVLLDKLILSSTVFVDVGANHGEFTLFAAKRIMGGIVFSFEPSENLFNQLKRNVEANSFTNVRMFNLGLGEESKITPLFTSTVNYSDGTIHSGMPTLYQTNVRNKHIENVKIVSLDSFLKNMGLDRIDIMKIDVEGSELSVLRGSQNTIKKFKPVIIIEAAEETCCSAGYTVKELFSFIKTFGYRFELILCNGKTKWFDVDNPGIFQNVICYPE